MMKLVNTLKTLLLLFAFAFFGINTSFGMYQYYQIGIDSIPSDWNNQYDITFLKKGVFNTNYLGTVKPLIALNNQYLLFWNQYGLYLYNYSTYKNTNRYGLIQGYFQYVYSCDEITESGDGVSNCSSSQNVLGSDEIVVNFIKTLSNGDWIYIYDEDSRSGCGGYCTYDRYRISVCFSSQSIGKSLCFASDLSTANMDGYRTVNPLTGSMQLGNNINFGNINRGILYNPPGFIAGGNDGSGTTTPGIVVRPCHTIGEENAIVESLYNYSSSLCYSPTKVISIQGEPTINEVPSQSIFELYPSYSEFANDLSLYNSCSSSSVPCFSVFSGRDVNYAFISNYVKTVRESRPQSFYNYCNSVINLDPNLSTCLASTGSQILPGTEYNSQEEMVNSMVGAMEIYNYNTYNWGSNGTGGSGGNNESGFSFDVLSDSWSGVNSLFTSFNYRDGVSGILPKYIVIGFLGILLLYLFKK